MDRPPETILLLVVDSLRLDRVGRTVDGVSLTPFLDTLWKKGLSFEAAYAPAPWTVPVHGSLFTGDLPSYHNSHRKTKVFDHESEATLAGTLADAGYHTAGISANPWLTPELGFDTGFDTYEYLEPTPPFKNEPAAPDEEIGNLKPRETALTVLSWVFDGNPLKRAANGAWKRLLGRTFDDGWTVNDAILDEADLSNDRRQFVFANYMDVHDPHYDSRLKEQFREGPIEGRRKRQGILLRALAHPIPFQAEPGDPERARKLYDDAVHRIDDILRELFDGLNERVDLERTLTVILGDHGECMGEHGYWGHGSYLHEELLRVPLLVLPPADTEMSDLRVDGTVSLVDLPHLICEAAGVELPDERTVDGNSFRTERPVFAECTGPRPIEAPGASEKGYRGVIDDDWKLVRDRETGSSELYALRANSSTDPEHEGVKRRLEKFEAEAWRRPERRRGDDDKDLSDSTTDRLRDLGYIS